MDFWFDMDGTIADFYNVPEWLEFLKKEDTTPYREAKTIGNAQVLARYMNRAIDKGHTINIISWCSKTGSEEFNARIAQEKLKWLQIHFKSVKFERILIVPYGTNKRECVGTGQKVLFDDEERNRREWKVGAFEPDDIIPVLKYFIKGGF